MTLYYSGIGSRETPTNVLDVIVANIRAMRDRAAYWDSHLCGTPEPTFEQAASRAKLLALEEVLQFLATVRDFPKEEA